MADTVRSTDDLLNASTGLFKDNTAGDISAQDLRDFTLSTYRPQGFCTGRLTLTSGTAFTTADVTSATSVYFTPYRGNLVGLYDGTSWKLYTFSELTLALGTITSGANYDVFLYDASGTLTLKMGPAWTSDTGRGTGAGTTELQLKDGVWTNKVSIASGPGANAGRYLGTFRTTATTTTEDSETKRFLWNAYNCGHRKLKKIESTASWTYGTSTWRSANNSTANRVEVVVGLTGPLVSLQVNCVTGASGYVAIGEDSTSSPHADAQGRYCAGSSNAQALATLSVFPAIGYHYYQWMENRSSGTVTFYGTNTVGGAGYDTLSGIQGFLSEG